MIEISLKTHIYRSDLPEGVEIKYTFCVCEGERGKYYLSPASEGPAERAGVQAGDHLLSINGVMVSKLTHSALMKMVGWHGIHQNFYLLLLFLSNL